MKKRKKFIQPCELGGSIYGKKRSTSKTSNTSNSKAQKKNLVDTYNKFYKDQAEALYRAIQGK